MKILHGLIVEKVECVEAVEDVLRPLGKVGCCHQAGQAAGDAGGGGGVAALLLLLGADVAQQGLPGHNN